MITSWVNHLEKQRTKMNTKSKKKQKLAASKLIPYTKLHKGTRMTLGTPIQPQQMSSLQKTKPTPILFPLFFYNQKQNSKHFPSLLMTKFQPPREKETKLTASLFLLDDPLSFFFFISDPNMANQPDSFLSFLYIAK